MKKGFSFLLLFFAICFGVSCKRNITRGAGAVATETRTVHQFTAVAVDAPVDVLITVGAITAVEISGYENLVPLIKTEIKGDALRIFTDELTHIKTDKDVIVKITVPSLSLLKISGAGEATIAGNFNVDKFNLDIAGAGDVTIDNITGNTFSAGLSGAGSVHIKGGNVNTAVFDVTGAGEVAAYPLVARYVEASVTGAGDVEVTATEKLDANITGIGDISYKGHPTVLKNITGAGSIESAN